MKLKLILGAIIASTFSLSSYAETYTSEQVSRAIDRNLQSATAGQNYTAKDIQSMRMMLLKQANYAADQQNLRQEESKKKSKNSRQSKYKRQSLLQSYKERAKKHRAKKKKKNNQNYSQKPFSSMDQLRRMDPDSIR